MDEYEVPLEVLATDLEYKHQFWKMLRQVECAFGERRQRRDAVTSSRNYKPSRVCPLCCDAMGLFFCRPVQCAVCQRAVCPACVHVSRAAEEEEPPVRMCSMCDQHRKLCRMRREWQHLCPYPETTYGYQRIVLDTSPTCSWITRCALERSALAVVTTLDSGAKSPRTPDPKVRRMEIRQQFDMTAAANFGGAVHKGDDQGNHITAMGQALAERLRRYSALFTRSNGADAAAELDEQLQRSLAEAAANVDELPQSHHAVAELNAGTRKSGQSVRWPDTYESLLATVFIRKTLQQRHRRPRRLSRASGAQSQRSRLGSELSAGSSRALALTGDETGSSLAAGEHSQRAAAAGGNNWLLARPDEPRSPGAQSAFSRCSTRRSLVAATTAAPHRFTPAGSVRSQRSSRVPLATARSLIRGANCDLPPTASAGQGETDAPAPAGAAEPEPAQGALSDAFSDTASLTDAACTGGTGTLSSSPELDYYTSAASGDGEPVVVLSPTETSTRAGQLAKFTCHVRAGACPVEIEWHIKRRHCGITNSGPVSSGDDPRLMVTSAGRQLVIFDTVPEDSGQVLATASNRYGAVTASTQLTVADRDFIGEAPVFTRPLPKAIAVAGGQRLTLRCRAAGYPTPRVIFLFQSADMADKHGSGGRDALPEGAQLIDTERRGDDAMGQAVAEWSEWSGRWKVSVPRPTGRHAGSYTALAVNRIGAATCRCRVDVHKPMPRPRAAAAHCASNGDANTPHGVDETLVE